MQALLLTLLGVFGGGFLALVAAVALGQLVPASRVTDRDAIISRLESAAEKREEAYSTLRQIVDRQAMLSDVTKAVLEATQATASGKTGAVGP